MDISYATIETCSNIPGIVVVIDVWRSFTTAACAFDKGVREIITAESTEEALAVRDRFPDVLLMGMGVSVVGPPVEGFDFGNSPVDIMDSDLSEDLLIQCTPNGTRGIVRSGMASMLLAGSFVCAGATVRYIKKQSPSKVTFVNTETGLEDQACGEYMAALLRDETPDARSVLNEIHELGMGRTQDLINKGVITKKEGAKLIADLECCLSLDRFDFVMLVKRQDGFLVMKPVS